MSIRIRRAGCCSAESIRFLLAATICIAFCPLLRARAPSTIWNLTKHTVAKFHLAPAGTTNWGKNQCENDKDGTVDVDERLRITDVKPGRFDARIIDVSGRECLVPNIEIKAGEIFSVEEKDLVSCKP